MSKNKGKDGEMRVAKLICNIVTKEEDCDFVRPTNTNTADGGADLILEHPENLTHHIISIAKGDSSPSTNPSTSNNIVKTRIDVKATDKKLPPETVKKFGGDIRKNPDCKGHMLLGGTGLTRGAQKKFDEIREAAAEDGKEVLYVPVAGLVNLENYYNSLPNPDSETDNE